MAHGGKKCRQEKIDGGMRSCTDARTRCDECANVALRQYVLEQLVVQPYM